MQIGFSSMYGLILKWVLYSQKKISRAEKRHGFNQDTIAFAAPAVAWVDNSERNGSGL